MLDKANVSSQTEEIDRAMRPFVDRGEVSGVVTLVADGKKIVHLSALGHRDLANHLPMETDTIFWIASMTKIVTAVAMMMFLDKGKLSLDDPVAKFIPEFGKLKTPSGKAANLTLRHIATHTSGLGEATKEVFLTAKTLGELVPSWLSQPMQFEPGAKWAYCQSGINTLGRIVEILSGQQFDDFVQDRIAAPLGMTDTSFYPTPSQVERVAEYYAVKEGKLQPVANTLLAGAMGDRNHYPAANGGLFSTAGDYARFCQMLLSGGSLNGKQYLRSETIHEMTRVQTEGIAEVGFVPGSAWGIGFSLVDKPQGVSAMLSRRSYGHGGVFGTQAWIDPTRQRIYILMISRADLKNSDDSVYRKAFQQAAASV
jgi:CubicO group peptidase (beta-lactamase class C family)